MWALLQLHLHSRFNTWLQWIGQENCKTRRETFKFGDLEPLISEVWRYKSITPPINQKTNKSYRSRDKYIYHNILEIVFHNFLTYSPWPFCRHLKLRKALERPHGVCVCAQLRTPKTDPEGAETPARTSWELGRTRAGHRRAGGLQGGMLLKNLVNLISFRVHVLWVQRHDFARAKYFTNHYNGVS